MKSAIALFLCLAFISCQEISAPVDPQQTRAVHFREDSYATDSLFSVENYTHVNIGSVTIRQSDSSNAYINVTDSGTYTTSISAAPVSVIVNNHVLAYTAPVWVQIDEHTWIHATWSSDVVVVDRSEVN
ncbi:MAG: hypothetical protein Q8896_00635 [Bacteroidota bacterium]|nr:hypothetical protein [Bacteroidota bacterium]